MRHQVELAVAGGDGVDCCTNFIWDVTNDVDENGCTIPGVCPCVWLPNDQLPPDQIIPGEYGACVKDSSGCVVYANCSNKYHETSYNTDAYLAERAYFNVTWMKVYTKSPGPPTPPAPPPSPPSPPSPPAPPRPPPPPGSPPPPSPPVYPWSCVGTGDGSAPSCMENPPYNSNGITVGSYWATKCSTGGPGCQGAGAGDCRLCHLVAPYEQWGQCPQCVYDFYGLSGGPGECWTPADGEPACSPPPTSPPPPPPPPSPPMVYCTDYNTTENVAAGHFGITVTASTVNAHNDPALGIDGNEGTRWESSFADAQWYEIDLGTQRRCAPPRFSGRMPPPRSSPSRCSPPSPAASAAPIALPDRPSSSPR